MIKLEMASRDHLVIGQPDITFTKSVHVDLGNLTCVIEHIGGDHSDDCSLVYVPGEKVIFLGDCLGDDIYHNPSSYNRERLYPMIDEIRKYDAAFRVGAHSSPKPEQKSNEFLN